MDSIENVEKIIKENDLVLLYFGSKTCGVCQVLKPKVKELLQKYPNIRFNEVSIDESQMVSAQYQIFSIPAILLFIQGKESIREIRHISLMELEKKISKYYELFYGV